jgi:hypothetical protein
MKSARARPWSQCPSQTPKHQLHEGPARRWGAGQHAQNFGANIETLAQNENYTAKPPKDYPNRVGDEDEPNTALGVAWMLLKSAQSAESPALKPAQ